MRVILDSKEYLNAMLVGCMRACQDRKEGRSHTFGARPEDAEMYDIRGAVGEAIVAKALGIFWLGGGQIGGDDVGPYQVRATGHRSGSLRLHHKDADEKAFVSVYVCEGSGVIAGWMYGRDGKKQEYWSDPTGKGRPAFFIPSSDLRPITELSTASFAEGAPARTDECNGSSMRLGA